ncbi:MAG: FtsQ-type POTRA domain-containing protein [Candidatus Thiodiazotropha taylori]
MSNRRRTTKPQQQPLLTEQSLLWLKLALLSLLMISALYWVGRMLADPAVMPVRTVGVDGEMRFVKRERLEQVVAEAVNGSFFSVDLKRMRLQIEAMPWVKQASIRRVWPDKLRVQVTEHQPLAYWGKGAMVSQLAEVFEPQTLPQLPGLVTLVGDAQQAKTITREYQRMQTLLDTAGLSLTRIWVDARQAWRIKTEGGLLLQLGRRDVMQRLTRFVRLYPDLMAQQDRQLVSVDLRYTNGFSVQWRTLQDATAGAGQALGFYRDGARMSRADSDNNLRKTGKSPG